MTKFLNTYRVESTRLKGYDYSSNGMYFITICTKQRKHFFGEISNGVMIRSDIGDLAYACWNAIPVHFPFVILDAFVVMPDHVHGILCIDKPVETQNFASLRKPNAFGPQSQNLASIIRGFKIGVTKNAGPEFSWQPRFHDRIIRNENACNRIRTYIINNPLNWNRKSSSSHAAQNPV